MGVIALLQPTRVTRCFSVPTLPADMRNEVRAVYGGFGVAMAALLIAATLVDAIESGVLLSVAVALLGMALGRLISLVIDTSVGKYPYLFLGLECLIGGALLYLWLQVGG